MFIFICDVAKKAGNLLIIYIPLCLYLYDNSFFIRFKAKTFTFHYVYIYISKGFTVNPPIFIFTFHYVYIYMLMKTQQRRIKRIYIPLCLYLYDSGKEKKITQKNLHSTMFIFIFSHFSFDLSSLRKFTFHYVYIYIWQTARRKRGFKNLHSTMFIFIFNLFFNAVFL